MKFVHWLLERLKEPSTYAGFSGAALAFGLSETQFTSWSAAAAALSGVIAMIIAETPVGEPDE